MNLGDFRGWLDTAALNASAKEVLEVYRKVAEMPREEERAYCVAEGLRKDVVVLCFGWRDDRDGLVRRLLSPPARMPTHHGLVLRPFVLGTPMQWEVGIPDIFSQWPTMDCDDLAYSHQSHVNARAAHIDSYFEHFAHLIDRRTLLMRTQEAPCTA